MLCPTGVPGRLEGLCYISGSWNQLNGICMSFSQHELKRVPLAETVFRYNERKSETYSIEDYISALEDRIGNEVVKHDFLDTEQRYRRPLRSKIEEMLEHEFDFFIDHRRLNSIYENKDGNIKIFTSKECAVERIEYFMKTEDELPRVRDCIILNTSTAHFEKQSTLDNIIKGLKKQPNLSPTFFEAIQRVAVERGVSESDLAISIFNDWAAAYAVRANDESIAQAISDSALVSGDPSKATYVSRGESSKVIIRLTATEKQAIVNHCNMVGIGPYAFAQSAFSVWYDTRPKFDLAKINSPKRGKRAKTDTSPRFTDQITPRVPDVIMEALEQDSHLSSLKVKAAKVHAVLINRCQELGIVPAAPPPAPQPPY